MSGCRDLNAFSLLTACLTDLLYKSCFDTGGFCFYVIPVMSQCRNTFCLLVWDSVTQRTFIVFTFSGSDTGFCTGGFFGYCPVTHLMSGLRNHHSAARSFFFTVSADFSLQPFLRCCCFFYNVFYPCMICFRNHSALFIITVLTGSGLCSLFCTGCCFFHRPCIIILMSCGRKKLIVRYGSANCADRPAVSINRTGSRMSFLYSLMSGCRNLFRIPYISTETAFFLCITSFRTGSFFRFIIIPVSCDVHNRPEHVSTSAAGPCHLSGIRTGYLFHYHPVIIIMT